MSDDNLLLPASNPEEHELRVAAWELALHKVDAMTDTECGELASSMHDSLEPERWAFLAMAGDAPRSVCRRWFWLLHWSDLRGRRGTNTLQ